MKLSVLLALVALALAAMALLLLVLKKRGLLNEGAGAPWPLYVRHLMSQPEQVLYHRLVRALPEHIVLAQVQVSRVLGVKKGANFHEWNNRINRLSYDFVVCTKDCAVVAAIELDDKSHESSSRVKTDEKKSKASEDAGLRLVRWHVRSLPGEEEIRTALLVPVPSALESPPATQPNPRPSAPR